MEPKRLKDLFNTERLKLDRETLKSMGSRPRLFERCSFSGDIIGCR